MNLSPVDNDYEGGGEVAGLRAENARLRQEIAKARGVIQEVCALAETGIKGSDQFATTALRAILSAAGELEAAAIAKAEGRE